VPLDEAVRGVAACPCARHQESFVAALAAVDELILRLMDPVGSVTEGVGEGGDIHVATAIGPDGRSFLHAYTNLEAAQASCPGGTFITVGAQSAFRMAVAHGNQGLLVTATGSGDAWAAVTAEGLSTLIGNG